MHGWEKQAARSDEEANLREERDNQQGATEVQR